MRRSLDGLARRRAACVRRYWRAAQHQRTGRSSDRGYPDASCHTPRVASAGGRIAQLCQKGVTVNQAGTDTPDEPVEETIGRHPELDLAPWLPRLDQLARKFVGMEFQSLDELWQIQTDLLAFQRDLQAVITDGKSKMRRNRSLVGQVKFLRGVLGHARRLGDAIAWAMLGGNRRVIYFLSQNSRVPVGPDEYHGERGLVAAASGFI